MEEQCVVIAAHFTPARFSFDYYYKRNIISVINRCNQQTFFRDLK